MKRSCAAGAPDVGKSIRPSSTVCASAAPARAAPAKNKASKRKKPFRIVTPENLFTINPLRQRGRRADEARAKRDLPAVVLLVADPVVHPGQPRSLVPVEPRDELEHLEVSSFAQLRRAVLERPAEGGEELAPCSLQTEAARVLLEQRRVAL